MSIFKKKKPLKLTVLHVEKGDVRDVFRLIDKSSGSKEGRYLLWEYIATLFPDIDFILVP